MSNIYSYVPKVAEAIKRTLAAMSARDADTAWTAPEQSGLLFLSRSVGHLDAVMRRCESPIEQLVALAFVERWDIEGWMVAPSTALEAKVIGAGKAAGIGCTEVPGASGYFYLGQQCAIEKPIRARIDFVVEGLDGERIAIECDGHDFHERTPEQAERDRSRDRALTLDGWTVLRFTGREIYRSAIQVVDAVEKAIVKLSPAIEER